MLPKKIVWYDYLCYTNTDNSKCGPTDIMDMVMWWKHEFDGHCKCAGHNKIIWSAELKADFPYLSSKV